MSEGGWGGSSGEEEGEGGGGRHLEIIPRNPPSCTTKMAGARTLITDNSGWVGGEGKWVERTDGWRRQVRGSTER